MSKALRTMANKGHFDRDTLRHLRVGKRLSQGELGKAIGASAQAVNAWESGLYEPRFSQVVKLAAFFGFTTEFFLKPEPAATEPAGTEG